MSFQQTIYGWLGRMIGLDPIESVSGHSFSLAAPWAQRAPVLLLLGIMGLVAVAGFFYFRQAPKAMQEGHWWVRHRVSRIVLFVIRSAVLCLVLLLLAEPTLTLTIQSRKRPALWLLFDGTDSMNIADDLPPDIRAATDKAAGIEQGATQGGSPLAAPSRMDYLRALVGKKDENLLDELDKQYRLQAFLFESTESVRPLVLSKGLGAFDGRHLAEQLTANGQVTDIGGAIDDLAHRNPSSSLAGLVMFSDFNKTTGPDPAKAAQQFGARIYTVGVGATKAISVDARIVAAPYARTKEESPITVVLQPSGLGGQTTHVRLYVEPLGGGARTLVGDKQSPPLAESAQSVEFIYKPAQPGRMHLVAEVDRVPGEAAALGQEKNRADAEIIVLDDYLRLMFVEYEPTWEWRFIKEVFHRDPLVGMKGFRTFLYSSDPQVREKNRVFLPTMIPPREEFFKNDLIFLGDMPSGPSTQPGLIGTGGPPALSDRFCKLVKEFVGDLGGGLVILSGPRFGPQQLVKTPLADLLPVTIDPKAQVRDQAPFDLKLTVQAAAYPFMQLGESSSLDDMQRAWDALGPLPWYQPAAAIQPSATVLAEHPTATCGGGRKQPLIAIRQYGRGEVVYLAFNETWRLRKAHGEELYRRFWKELMWRLALNHALGAGKRFVVQTDRQRYQVGSIVTVNVNAADAQYKALSEKEVPGGKLSGQWVLPAAGSQVPVVQPIALTQVEPGLFATRFAVTSPGEHRVRVTDPVTNKPVAWSFTAIGTSVERQSPIRNSALQEAIAAESGGRSCDLKDVQSLADQIQPALRTESSLEVISLVNTWACFALIGGLLVGEWLFRKRIGLP